MPEMLILLIGKMSRSEWVIVWAHTQVLSTLYTNGKWDVANSTLGPSTPRGQVDWLAISCGG